MALSDPYLVAKITVVGTSVAARAMEATRSGARIAGRCRAQHGTAAVGAD